MLSSYLKEETRKAHDSIETTVDLMSWVQNPQSYKKLLEAFYGYYKTIEQLLMRSQKEFETLGLSLQERSKLSQLEQDLKDLGMTQKEIYEIKTLNHPHEIKNLYSAFGTLYVLEGSTLGGQVINRELSKVGVHSHFFSSYGKETMPMWMKFKKVLDALPAGHEAEILQSAKDTFKSMESWLVGKSKPENRSLS